MNKKHIRHLYWRAGFGIDPKSLEAIANKSRFEVVDELFYASRRSTPLYFDKSDLKDIDPEHINTDKRARENLRLLLIEKTKDLNLLWIDRLRNPKELLRERMTLFWANHFVCQSNNAVFAEQYNNTLRMMALGNFRTFVKAISREAAMINYLNLKQNRKTSPNENFARELMELFTLGRGHYTEQDIKESARAFTGYGHDFYGKFQFRKRQHDYQRKTFFKRSGRFDGDDIIDIILLEKKCAKFICEKVYKSFVNENLNENHIDQMVDIFYPSYDIEKLMRFVFMSDWFYDEVNIGTKIKSPVELLVGLSNTVPIQFNKKRQVLSIQRMLGQLLLFPPNGAGWKTGQNWIDSNTIILRFRLPALLLNDAAIAFKDEGEFHDKLYNEMIKKRGKDIFLADANWAYFRDNFDRIDLEQLPDYILQCKLSDSTSRMFKKLRKDDKESYALQLMSIPEYQMC